MAQSHRVLIVEDDPDMREIESQILGYAGYEVLLAANGQEALERVSDQGFDVILLDLMMPVMDGLTFLAQRRRLRLAQGVPILCVSAGGVEMLKHALRLGATECLQKPIDIDQLCGRVEHYCASA